VARLATVTWWVVGLLFVVAGVLTFGEPANQHHNLVHVDVGRRLANRTRRPDALPRTGGTRVRPRSRPARPATALSCWLTAPSTTLTSILGSKPADSRNPSNRPGAGARYEQLAYQGRHHQRAHLPDHRVPRCGRWRLSDVQQASPRAGDAACRHLPGSVDADADARPSHQPMPLLGHRSRLTGVCRPAVRKPPASQESSTPSGRCERISPRPAHRNVRLPVRRSSGSTACELPPSAAAPPLACEPSGAHRVGHASRRRGNRGARSLARRCSPWSSPGGSWLFLSSSLHSEVRRPRPPFGGGGERSRVIRGCR
jgi:hypothetical protein